MSNSNFSVSENNEGNSYFTNEEGITSWNKPSNDPLPEGWTEEISEDYQRYYVHPTHGSFWNRPKKNGSPRRLHMAAVVAPVAPAAAVNERVAKYEKMKKMGIPEGSIRQKMMMNGVDPSLLFGGPPMAAPGRPKLNLSVLPTLKKTKNGNAKKNNKKPNNKNKASAGNIARAAVAQLGKLRKVNRSVTKKNNKKANTNTGFAKFQKELATRAAKTAAPKSLNVFGRERKRQTNKATNNYNANNSWNNNSWNNDSE